MKMKWKLDFKLKNMLAAVVCMDSQSCCGRKE